MATTRDEENNNSTNLDALLQWAAEIGISDSPQPSSSSSCLGHSLLVSNFPNAGGRGLGAARDLKRGEMVLRVPRSALMTSDSVLLRDEKMAACVKRHPLLTKTQILTVCLLAEVGKGRSSQWYPYLVQLPRRYDMLPNFSQLEIRALQVEDAIWIAEKAVLKFKSDWKEAVPLMRELELKPQFLTFRSWLWAFGSITSRTLHIPWDDAGCLCPVGDLFNYAAPDEEYHSEDLDDRAINLQINDSSSLNCKGIMEQLDAVKSECCSLRLTDGGYEEDLNSYCFYARQEYKMGEQVLLSYGTYTNLELLEHYGFFLHINPNDKAFIQLDTDMYKLSSWPKDSIYIQPDGSPSFALLCTLRLWATPINHRKSVGFRAYSGSSVSTENELIIMKWLGKHCRNILGKLPTTIEDDELLLDVIDKILDCPSHVKYSKLPSFEELKSLLEENGLQKEGVSDCLLSTKTRKSLDQWRLAVQWRLSHKKIILNCISYCNSKINIFSSELLLKKNGSYLRQ